MEHRQISRLHQVNIYTKKCFRIFAYEKGWKAFISATIITLLISFVTSSDMFDTYAATRNGAFALVCACIWIGIFNSIQSICKERDIIKREHRSGLSISAYVVSHTIYDFALCAVEALIVTIIVTFTNYSNMPIMGILLPLCIELYITFFLAIWASDVLGIMVSSIVKSTNTAMTVMPFILIIQLIMSGMIFELEGLASLVSQFTVSKWSLNAICSIADINAMEDSVLSTYAYPEHYDSTLSNLSACWGILLVFIFFYCIFAIISLKFIDKDKR